MNEQEFKHLLQVHSDGEDAMVAIEGHAALIIKTARSIRDSRPDDWDLISDFRGERNHGDLFSTYLSVTRVDYSTEKETIMIVTEDHFCGETDYDYVTIPMSLFYQTKEQRLVTLTALFDYEVNAAKLHKELQESQHVQKEKEEYERLKAQFEPQS